MSKHTASTKKTTSKKTPRRKPAPKKTENQAPQLNRMYKGKELVVDVVDGGYQFEGQTFKSLSGLAKHIVGYGISGPQFFKSATQTADQS